MVGANMMTGVMVVLILLCLLVPLAVVGEVFLALRPGRWAGLTLPGIFLLPAVSALWWAPRIVGMRAVPVAVLLCCIPAAVLLLVYAICRQVVKRRKLDELKRMEIQDL